MKTIYEFLSQGSSPVDVLQCSIHESGSVTPVLFCLFRFLLGGTRSLASSQVFLHFAVARRAINEFIDKEARVTLVRDERLESIRFLRDPREWKKVADAYADPPSIENRSRLVMRDAVNIIGNIGYFTSE